MALDATNPSSPGLKILRSYLNNVKTEFLEVSRPLLEQVKLQLLCHKYCYWSGNICSRKLHVNILYFTLSVLPDIRNMHWLTVQMTNFLSKIIHSTNRLLSFVHY